MDNYRVRKYKSLVIEGLEFDLKIPHLTPQKAQADEDGKPVMDAKNCFQIKTELTVEDITNTTITSWKTPKDWSEINKTKLLLTTFPSLMVYHDTTQDRKGQKYCQGRHNNHFHVVLDLTKSDKKLSAHPMYRQLKQTSKYGNKGEDLEIDNVEELVGEIEEDDIGFAALQATPVEKRKQKENRTATEEKQTHVNLGKIPLMQSMIDRQQVLTALLKKFPQAKTLSELVSLVQDKPTRDKLISMHHTTGANTSFNIAETLASQQVDNMTVLELLQEVVEINLEEYHTPLHTAQMIIGFLEANNINPVVWFTVWRSVIKERFPRKRGIAITGESNPGKTLLTKVVFECLNQYTGEVSTQDTFPFQGLVGKKNWNLRGRCHNHG
ncbi:hypothetical protein PoB_003073900 [Plakobranchus ocellatus]|uniref:Parvovirus non-structural protein 1 helicase domain-containing protein n=1 Tax=Plakobranchus ocellatus TaxID=259542 RepID=A0AAV4A993_9GAST|nr:hypothetical protein PoB_003073900 [Plakobranchus ocellatus]